MVAGEKRRKGEDEDEHEDDFFGEGIPAFNSSIVLDIVLVLVLDH
jgi:hypothetical protein